MRQEARAMLAEARRTEDQIVERDAPRRSHLVRHHHRAGSGLARTPHVRLVCDR
jgi:hypothetical protein